MRLALLLTVAVGIAALIFILGTAFKPASTDTNISTSTATSTQPNTNLKEITVNISAQNNSGQEGSAKITEAGGRAKVFLQLTGGPSNISQPAEIRKGSCSTPGDMQYPLTAVRNGKSETVLPISFSDLLKQFPLKISIYKSLSERDANYACGDIRK